MPFGSPSTRWRTLALTLGVGLAIASPATAAILPPDRLTTWNPGIPGGIPVRTTVCATINASTYGSGLLDATAGIQAALDACPVGQVVQLSAGDFMITSPLQLTKSIVLRGQGPTQTKLKMPVGTNANLITIGQQWFPGLIQSTNLASDAVKGSQTAVLVSNPGLTVGEIVFIDQLTDPNISHWDSRSPPGDPSRGWFCRMDRPLGQVMEVASVSGNTITFTTPFHITYQTAFTAQLSRSSDQGSLFPVVKYAGVEDLYVSGGSLGQGNIWLHAAYSWIKNIESDFQDGRSIQVDGSFRSVVRDSYVHSTQSPAPGGGGYGIALAWYSADNLVENNIVWNMNKVMVMESSGGGNVIGYNYMEDGWINYATTFVETGLNASHMTTAHYELFEGNQSFNFDGDNVWGGNVYVMIFRNHLTGKRRSVAPLTLVDASNRHAAGLGGGDWWCTFVGNVLGTLGQDPSPNTSFTYESAYPWPDDPVPMWQLGYTENFGPADPKVLSTVLRGGNFDYFTNSVHWENIPAQTIPDSLYLTSKPAFFGSNPWPWVDPTGVTKLYTLPARARFDAGNPNPTTYTLSVAKAGTGSGTVTSSPGGINCGASCSANYTAATLVTLTAAPGAGSLFSGWSACSGTGTCQVTMSAAQSVTATFTMSTTPPTVSLTAPSTGQTVSGSVTVSATASDPVGVAGVQFKLDGANLGAEVTTSPYSTPWATTGSTNGSHTLTAVARNTANNTATSAPVTVTASNAPPPTLSINDVSVNQPASGTANAVFTVTLSAASAQAVTVVYVTADGTATAGTDYMAATGNLSFPPGTTAQTLTVQISGDPTPEANETFFVNLSTPAGATIAKAQGTGTIVGPAAQNVVWANAVGVSVSGNNLTKTAAAGWNAGASSTTALLSGDGYVEFTVSETTTDRMLGLSNKDVDQNYTSIRFAADLTSSGALQVYEMGVNRGSFGTYATGDVVRLAVESGVVTYRRNGALLYTSTAAIYPLLVDTSLSTTGATLGKVVVSANWAALPPPPTAPTNLTATAVGSSQINLSWTNTSPSQTGVKIERSVDNATFTQITVAGATAVSYSNTGLNASTTYFYRVRTTNLSGDSAYSATASATTQAPLPPPTAPTSLAATAAGSGQINLSWTNTSTSQTGVKIERSVDNATFTQITVATAAAVSYSDTGLNASTTYFYRVRATNASGDSPYSNTASAATQSRAIAFVQKHYATPQTPVSTVRVAFIAAQSAGNLNVVVVGWNDATAQVASVTDTKGNAYQLAVGPTVFSGTLTQSIYYARNITAAAAGANAVTVSFTLAANYPDIRVLEYSGLDGVSPVDATAAATGTTTTSSTPAVVTTHASDLLFAANTVATWTSGAGTGWRNRIITTPDADIAEDRVVSTAGSYLATAPLGNAGPWVMQVVALKGR
jgi:hypothetical protein